MIYLKPKTMVVSIHHETLCVTSQLHEGPKGTPFDSKVKNGWDTTEGEEW